MPNSVDWNDPATPCGDSPPLPTWPVILAGIVWAAWIVFLAVMTAIISKPSPV